MVTPLTTDPLAALLHRLTRQANEAADVDAVLATAVHDICETLEWPAGVAHREAVEGPVPGTVVGPDVPVPDDLRTRASSTGLPQWEQTSDPAAPAPLVVVVPVLTEAGPLGALHFAAPTLEGGIAQLLGTIGWQLGMVAQRAHDRRELERRETALERSNEELERFAYVASHDLQEPLRKVVTACELLQRRHAERLPEDAVRYVDVAVDGATRMQQLIRDLLAYSRVAREDTDANATSHLADVVSQSLEELSILIDEVDATVTVGDLPSVAVGAREAGQVVTNLVSNAVKYRGADPPEISIRAEDRQQGMVELLVCDNGIGIDPEYHDRIFDVFRRLHRRDEYSGTGVGLAIVKRIAEHHGGRAWVTSPPDGGSCFHVLLPRGDRS